ncbi:MAG: NuoM family protein [Phycisphaerae bacterium]
MTLIAFIAIPILAGLVAWPLARWRPRTARCLCLAALAADLAWVCTIWASTPGAQPVGRWLMEFHAGWIPQIGVSFSLAMDGLSLLLVALTGFIGILAVAASWEGIARRVGFFHFNLMWLLGALVGVFLATDLFLFYFFWEMMLVPLYLLIGIWGHERRIYATVKFFIFTQAGSLLMLVAIIALVLLHGHSPATGRYTFAYEELLGTGLPPAAAMWIMLGFFAAFAVKLPAFGLHTWLPDAHTEAPTAGSVVLASLVLKAGAYGMLRFLVPLFPAAFASFAPVAMALAAAGIIYGAVMAFAQRDLKRLVAYTSVSHMGFVLLGVASGTEMALQGAVIVIISHALSTGGLFIVVGAMQDRMHTRDMARMGGLWAVAPRMGGTMLFLAMASLGLPGLAGFVGEFLVLAGTWQAWPIMTAVASLGLIAAMIYSLRMFMRPFHGPASEEWRIRDFGPREMAISIAIVAALVWVGIYPGPVLKTSEPTVKAIRQVTETASGGQGLLLNEQRLTASPDSGTLEDQEAGLPLGAVMNGESANRGAP